MYEQLPNPTIFAHRGASAYAPENTMVAFRLAIEQNADGIELDVKLSADDHVVVIHDATVDRTTPASGQVREMSLKELGSLDAGSHHDCEFQGERIPTLQEVFNDIGDLTFFNIELTNYASPFDNLPDRVVDMVRRYNLEHRVLFSSFNPIALVQVRKQIPNAAIGLLALPGLKGIWARSWIGRLIHYQALHPELHDVTQNLIKRVHQRGNRLHVYTVNKAEDMVRLYNMQVDGIFTDDPLLARKVLSRKVKV